MRFWALVAAISLLCGFSCGRSGPQTTSNRVLYSALHNPCGGELTETEVVPAVYNFTGHEQDSDLAQLDANARFYNPRHCRFDGLDPADVDTLAGRSGYTYVANNPLRFTDPTGNMPEDDDDKKKASVAATRKNYNNTIALNRLKILAGTEPGKSTGLFKKEKINPLLMKNLRFNVGIRSYVVANVKENESLLPAVTSGIDFTVLELGITSQSTIVSEFKRALRDDIQNGLMVPAGNFKRVKTGTLNGLLEPPGLRLLFGLSPSAQSAELSLLTTLNFKGLEPVAGTGLYRISGASAPLDVFARINRERVRGAEETPASTVYSLDFGGGTGFDLPLNGFTIGLRFSGGARREISGVNDRETTAIFQLRSFLAF